MRRTSFPNVVLWSLFCCALPRGLGADVLVVDAAGGGDFLAIQPAVDESSDGDVILVKSGVYAPFGIVHQELAVVADTGADVIVTGQVTVAHTLVEHEVVLVGLRVHAQQAAFEGYQDALVVLDARGPVRLERCELLGAIGEEYSYSETERGGDALRVTAALDVSLVRCTLRGGQGANSEIGFDMNRGGEGIRAEDARIAVHDSEVRGGRGGDGDFFFDDIPGNGGRGGRIVDSLLFGSGSSFSGGNGGTEGFECASGGHGLHLFESATDGYLLELSLQGGSASCSSAPNGQPLATASGATATFLPGSARHHTAPNPVREGDLASFMFTGEPGDEVSVLRASRAAFALYLPLNGVLLLELPFLARNHHTLGVIPPGGTLTTTILFPPLPPGVESSKLHLQSLFKDPTGRFFLGSPSTIVVLDASF